MLIFHYKRFSLPKLRVSLMYPDFLNVQTLSSPLYVPLQEMKLGTGWKIADILAATIVIADILAATIVISKKQNKTKTALASDLAVSCHLLAPMKLW